MYFPLSHGPSFHQGALIQYFITPSFKNVSRCHIVQELVIPLVVVVMDPYYRWSKDFLEAGKRRLAGDTVREANTDEVSGLKQENKDLKQAVAELYLRNDWLKKV